MKDRTLEFKNRDEKWRIEAVIHDGSWYTINKWARLAKVKKVEVEQWIKDNEGSSGLINVENSYRVGYTELMKWYNSQPELALDDRLIPDNFPPKIWDKQTEVEALINTPRRRVTEVTIAPDSHELLQKCREVLRGVAIIRFYRNGLYRACALSPTYIEQTLRRGLTSKEYEIIKPGRKAIMKYRELSDFSTDFLNNAIDFYVPFARTMLKNRMSTLQIYLPTQNDVDMQIAMWVMIALRKFDETQPVPFSGYLSRVLAFWPYDLPDEALGKELSSFQRRKQKAVNKLTRTRGESVVADELIIAEMGIDKKLYYDYSKEYRSWLAEHNATEITWGDSNNERVGEMMWTAEKREENTELAHNISLGVCEVAIETGDYKQALQIIETIGSVSEHDYGTLAKVSTDFKLAMWQTIKNPDIDDEYSVEEVLTNGED